VKRAHPAARNEARQWRLGSVKKKNREQERGVGHTKTGEMGFFCSKKDKEKKTGGKGSEGPAIFGGHSEGGFKREKGTGEAVIIGLQRAMGERRT